MTKRNLNFIMYFFLIAFIGIAVAACSKDKKTIIEEEWEVESTKVHADSASVNAAKSYILSFENNKNYNISLDVNTCNGKVSFNNKNRVDFDLPACTKICCDSAYAEKLVDILVAVNKYEVTDNSLTLTGGAGERIKLKKK